MKVDQIVTRNKNDMNFFKKDTQTNWIFTTQLVALQKMPATITAGIILTRVGFLKVVTCAIIFNSISKKKCDCCPYQSRSSPAYLIRWG